MMNIHTLWFESPILPEYYVQVKLIAQYLWLGELLRLMAHADIGGWQAKKKRHFKQNMAFCSAYAWGHDCNAVLDILYSTSNWSSEKLTESLVSVRK